MVEQTSVAQQVPVAQQTPVPTTFPVSPKYLEEHAEKERDLKELEQLIKRNIEVVTHLKTEKEKLRREREGFEKEKEELLLQKLEKEGKLAARIEEHKRHYGVTMPKIRELIKLLNESLAALQQQ